ncbi:MAG: chitinase-related protein [Monoraphidium minutum]|nr:MAG: chitinase-related protein [Monoraphidium minutum]
MAMALGQCQGLQRVRVTGSKVAGCCELVSALRSRPPHSLQALGGSRRGLRVAASAFDVSVRPYTLRKGDTLDSIARKRGFTVQQITSINHDVNPDKVKDGQTILLPASGLSARDKEILEGIGSVYRIYPVRKGEAVADIMAKRSITRAEMDALNSSINLDRLKEGQLLKLPANKFTVREREMLIGSGILPHEFFAATKNPFVLGVGALLMIVGFVMAWQRFYDEESADADEDEDEGRAKA